MCATQRSGSTLLCELLKATGVAGHPNVTVVKEEIVVTDVKPLLKEWSKTTLDDLACFDNTMTRIETDLDAMRLRANAWATGDMAALQALPPPYQFDACSSATRNSAASSMASQMRGSTRALPTAAWISPPKLLAMSEDVAR